MHAAFTELGSIDHLVLALGSSAGMGPIASLDLDGFRAGFEEKVVAHVAAIQAALPFLAERGSITLISAVSAQAAAPGAVALAAGNGAVEAMVPTLSRELAPIRVNAVSPGVIDTPWWAAVPVEQRQALFAASAERTALGRGGRPEDVADAILALIQSEYVSGTVLPCDGALRYA
jgi:NAD(P)-dependent dehydrogenase (short-subunit alcohol dehydrogenase family)